MLGSIFSDWQEQPFVSALMDVVQHASLISWKSLSLFLSYCASQTN